MHGKSQSGKARIALLQLCQCALCGVNVLHLPQLPVPAVVGIAMIGKDGSSFITGAL